MVDLSELKASGFIIENIAGGGPAFSEDFERLIAGTHAAIDTVRPAGASVLHFPPVIGRDVLERCDYHRNFPNLLGCIEPHPTMPRPDESGFAHDLAVAPAACFPFYPLLAARGPVVAEGIVADVRSFCFRNESYTDVDRLRAFRMREFVFAGSPEQASVFVSSMMIAVTDLFQRLGLSPRAEIASDPFFGRAAKFMAEAQQEKGLKHELVCPIDTSGRLTAVASFNAHHDKFSSKFGFTLNDGNVAHSCCVAFGLERVVVSLLSRHGLAYHRWPAQVLDLLRL